MATSPGDLATDSATGWDAKSADALEDHDGVIAAGRYQYNLTDQEVQTLHDRFIGVIWIGEYDTLTWHPILGGYLQGRSHAIDSVVKARARGWPINAGCVLWATSDTAVPPEKYGLAAEYVRGWTDYVRSMGFLGGLYGGEGLIQFCLARGVVDRGWGTAARSWNYGVMIDPTIDKRFVMRQRLGYVTFGTVVCDVNDVFHDPGDYHVELEKIEDDMSEQDVKAISDKIDQLGMGMLTLSLKRENRQAYQIKGNVDWLYIGENEKGLPLRVRLPDQDTVAALVQTGFLNTGVTELDPDYQDASGAYPHRAMIDALGKIPQVEFSY